jgi:hypothetical protein
VASYSLSTADESVATNRVLELDAQLQVERGARSLRDGDLLDALRRFEAAATDSVMWRFRAIRMALRVAPGFANHTMCMRAVAQLGRSLRPLHGGTGVLMSC